MMRPYTGPDLVAAEPSTTDQDLANEWSRGYVAVALALFVILVTGLALVLQVTGAAEGVDAPEERAGSSTHRALPDASRALPTHVSERTSSGRGNEPSATERVRAAGVSAPWLDDVRADVARREYDIVWHGAGAGFASPNRAQNLRVAYRSDGFAATPRCAASEPWRLTLDLIGIDRGAASLRPRHADLDSADAGLRVSGGAMVVQHDGFAIEYRNDPRGMRQNFIVNRRPAGAADLRVRLAASGDLLPRACDDRSVAFVDSVGTAQMYYRDLSVWDADGRELAAVVEVDGRDIALVVDDRDARYPVTVDPLATTPVWSRDGNQAYDSYGLSVAGAGDVNGDGYGDVVVGAPDYDNGQTGEGCAFVYLGSSSGPSTTAVLLEYNSANARFGFFVSSAGDVNGDGYDDIIVGAIYYNGGVGRAFVFNGSAGGIATSPSWVPNARSEWHLFGRCVDGAGDVNGDGYDDVIVGAPYSDAAYVYLGSSTGLALNPSWIGTGTGEYGTTVCGAGDVNGDGYADVAVAEFKGSNGQAEEGRALVYYGSSSGLASSPAVTFETNMANAELAGLSGAGDVNADGYDDLIVGSWHYTNGESSEGRAWLLPGSSSGLSATAAWTGEINVAGADFGASVSDAGDVNGDGYGDIIIGAPGLSNGQSYEGRAYVYYGSSTGISSASPWTVESNVAGAGLGEHLNAVGGAGDVNGDGYDDVIVGMPHLTNDQTNEGRAAVYLGGPDATIALGAPNGGEVFCAGTSRQITWTASGITNVKVEVSSDGGGTWTTLTTTGTGGSYFWLIPSTQQRGSDYRVRVSSATNGSINDVSTASFTIGDPPTLEVTLDNPILWPPDHAMVTIVASPTVSGGADPHVTLVSVTSSEVESGLGPDDLAGDIQGVATGSADHSFELRAERSSSGGGRVYTVRYEVSDLGGYTATRDAYVVVPSVLGTLAAPAATSCSATLGSISPGVDGVTLPFTLGSSAPVTLSVYNTKGREVARLINGQAYPAGAGSVVWDGRNTAGLAPGSAQPAGPYLAVLRACGAPVVVGFRLP